MFWDDEALESREWCEWRERFPVDLSRVSEQSYRARMLFLAAFGVDPETRDKITPESSHAVHQ